MSRMRGDFVGVGEVAARDEELRQRLDKVERAQGSAFAFPGGPADLAINGSWPVGGTNGVVARKRHVWDTVSVFIPGDTYEVSFHTEQYTNVSGTITVVSRIPGIRIADITDDDRAAGQVTKEIGPFEPNSSLGVLRLKAFGADGRVIATNPDGITNTPATRALADYLTTWNSTASQAVSNSGATYSQLLGNGKFSKQATDASGNTIANQLASWIKRDSTTWATSSNITTTTTDDIYWKQNERAAYWISKNSRLTQSLGRFWDKGEYFSFSMFLTCGSTFAPTITPILRDKDGTDVTDSSYVAGITLSADTTEHYVAFTLRIATGATINKNVQLAIETSTTLSSTNSIRFRKVSGVVGKEALPWFQEALPVANGDSYYVTVGGTKYPLQGSGDDEINGVAIPIADIGASPFDPDNTGTRQGFVDYRPL